MLDKRIKRVNSEMQKAIYEAINKIVLPKFPGSIVSVLEVKTTDDLSSSKVFLSFYSLNNKFNPKDIFDAIVKNTVAIRTNVAHNIKLRFMPELKFFIDTSFEDNKKLINALNLIKKDEE